MTEDASVGAEVAQDSPEPDPVMDDGSHTDNAGPAFTSEAYGLLAEALSEAEQVGATITSFVLNPVDLLILTTAKVASGWEQPLLGIDPSSPTKRSALGVPMAWSPAVTEGTIWAIPQAKTFTVIRIPATVVTDRSAYFSSDRLGIRSVLRASFAFPHEAAIVKITVGGS
jgi:hypothetical protein